MRYPKGSIQLNQSRDLPLLRQILHSEFVTHSQLFEFMRLSHCEQSRNSFDWRLRRLVERGLVQREPTAGSIGDFVYSVGRSAAFLLQGVGEYCLVGRNQFKEKKVAWSAHAIGLNDIHLSVLRAGLLLRWISPAEIRSQNELTRFGFAKDYDAIVTVRTDTGERRFALEYERSPKAIKYYRYVAASLSREIGVSYVLYLVCNYDLLQFVSGFFRNVRCRVCFGLVNDWHDQLLSMRVFCNSGCRCFRLQESLDDRGAQVAAVAMS